MSEHETNEEQAEPTEAPDPSTERSERIQDWELWAKISLLMAGSAVLAWLVVLLRLGEPSVFTHAFILSSLGVMTLPIIFWGLVKTVFNRPVLRRSRTIAFFLLVGVALFCNIPLFAVPLSTEGWHSEHTYRLPFDGEWVVTAGGQSLDTNYHATTAAYRWGYDFTKAKDGKRYSSDGKSLDDYYCYGQPVLAPTGGEVIDLEDGHKDNDPDTFDSESVLGNHLVIKVDEHEYLFVAHMKKDSLAVQKGEEISAGDKIGECGNSGRSLQPHVHYHLQNATDFPVSEGLPLRFSHYIADGQPVDKGMPEGSSDPEHPLGQRVENVR